MYKICILFTREQLAIKSRAVCKRTSHIFLFSFGVEWILFEDWENFFNIFSLYKLKTLNSSLWLNLKTIMPKCPKCQKEVYFGKKSLWICFCHYMFLRPRYKLFPAYFGWEPLFSFIENGVTFAEFLDQVNIMGWY